MNDPKLLEFGEKHLEVVLALDGIVGGSGFYGHATTKELADGFALGEDFLVKNSPLWTDPQAVEIRTKAGAGEDTTELRKDFAKRINPRERVQDLIAAAKGIKNPYQRKVRLDQANSLATVTDVLLTDIGLEKTSLNYVDALVSITGVSPPLIPTDDYMQTYKGKLLKLMGASNESLAEAAKKWREGIGLLSKKEMGKAYRRSAKLMIDILKRNGLPRDFVLKVEILKDAPFLGFFAYGNKAGDFYGETCMVESDTKCIFDIIHTSTHELTGHDFLDALWHDYARRTGDLYPAVGAMACNQAVLHEGFANCAADVFADDLGYLFDNISFGVERMSPKDLRRNLSISAGLERLAMTSIGYVAARFFHRKDIDVPGMEKEYIKFGVDTDRAASRAKHMGQAKNLLHPYCYFGPGYYPGMAVVEKIVERYGKQGTIDRMCSDLGPCSLSTLNGGDIAVIG